MEGKEHFRPAKEYRHFRVGNLRWRSPEAHTGLGLGKHSDVFAYALVCMWASTRKVPLGLDFTGLSKQLGISYDQLALRALFMILGPLKSGLVEYIDDSEWGKILEDIAADVGDDGGEDSKTNFKNWNSERYPHLVPALKRLILRIAKLDPAERPTMQQILEDPCWTELLKLES
ncbi:hypothetical protein MMC13_000733 [Lambiella insularis]|nr:hypothetical protein [Lambiella insularis]